MDDGTLLTSKSSKWRKSSYSQPTQSDCVEVALLGHVAAVRDSKTPEKGFLTMRPEAWKVLLTKIKQGAYDL